MSTIVKLLQGEKKYFIVVSDEGPASSPKQHPDFNSAYEESIRLAKLHPGIKFGVFEYKGHAVSARSKTKVTKWLATFGQDKQFRCLARDFMGNATLFDTKTLAEESLRNLCFPHDTYPIELETESADFNTVFNTYINPGLTQTPATPPMPSYAEFVRFRGL